MNRLKITKIKFTSYMKLYYIMSLCFGITVGFLGLIIGIFGGPVSVNIGDYIYTGLTGGILGLIIFPLFICIFGTLLGLLIYLPFCLFMKIKKSLILYIETEENNISIKSMLTPTK